MKQGFPGSNDKLLHIYRSGNNEYIVGNPKAFGSLKTDVEDALKGKIGGSQYWINDGEAYPLTIILFEGADEIELTINAQVDQHAEAFIIGKPMVLKELAKDCEKYSMADGMARIEHNRILIKCKMLTIICLDDYDKWSKLAVPYSEEYAAESREFAIWPRELIEVKS